MLRNIEIKGNTGTKQVQEKTLKGTTKLHFTLNLLVVIIFYNMTLSKSALTAYCFGKLVVDLSVFYVFSVYSVTSIGCLGTCRI